VLGNAKEATALERGHLNGVFATGAFTQDDFVRFTEVRAAKLDALARFSRLAPASRKSTLDYALRTPDATTAATFERRALEGAKGQQLKLSPTTWWDAMTTLVDDMHTVQQGIGDDVIARARQIKAHAYLQLAIYAGGGLLTVALGVLLWLYTFRSIMRPLQVLTGEAHAAAAGADRRGPCGR
jgi:sensor c-di-GMP phosphodiesterase-like protein